MDAREAREWLILQHVNSDDCDFRHSPNSQEELTPMTDEQWQKAKRLVDVLQSRFLYHVAGELGRESKREMKFVENFIQLPYDYPLNRRQSQLLERIWVKYRRFHEDVLAQPRWIGDYKRERWRIGGMLLYEWSEIGGFNGVQQFCDMPVDPYACDPENDKYTITFQDGDLW